MYYEQRQSRSWFIPGLLVAAVVVLIFAGVAIYLVVSSGPSSNPQQVAYTYSSQGLVGNRMIVMYWVVTEAGSTYRVPNETVYRQIQSGGGYDPDSHDVVSPDQEHAALAKQASTTVGGDDGDDNADDPDVQAPAVHKAPVHVTEPVDVDR